MKNVLMILCVMVLLVSCATTQTNLFSDAKITKANDSIVVSEKDLAQLKERVNEYWGYRIANNYTKAFDYEDPKTKEKYKINLEEYLTSKSSLKYHSIRIVDIDFIRNDYAKMKVMVKYTFDFFEPITDEKDITEKWVKREDGNWYRIFTTNIDQTPLEQ
jgi:hypothetical protein